MYLLFNLSLRALVKNNKDIKKIYNNYHTKYDIQYCCIDDNSYIAAKHGHLEYLKYAHENGCSWNDKTYLNASFNRHLECLKYAHENACPWDEMICDMLL